MVQLVVVLMFHWLVKAAVLLVLAFVGLAAADLVDLGERADGSIQKFHDVVGSNKPVVVEFFSPRCAHCRGFAPEYAEVARAFHGADVVIARVDVDRWDILQNEFKVERVPDIRFFAAGSKQSNTYPEFSKDEAGEVIEWIKSKTGLTANFRQVMPAEAADMTDMDSNQNVDRMGAAVSKLTKQQRHRAKQLKMVRGLHKPFCWVHAERHTDPVTGRIATH